MRNFKIVLQYEGTRYKGWQKQGGTNAGRREDAESSDWKQMRRNTPSRESLNACCPVLPGNRWKSMAPAARMRASMLMDRSPASIWIRS